MANSPGRPPSIVALGNETTEFHFKRDAAIEYLSLCIQAVAQGKPVPDATKHGGEVPPQHSVIRVDNKSMQELLKLLSAVSSKNDYVEPESPPVAKPGNGK